VHFWNLALEQGGGVFFSLVSTWGIRSVDFLWYFVFLFGSQQKDHSMTAAQAWARYGRQSKLQRERKSSTEIGSFRYCVYMAHGLFYRMFGCSLEAFQWLVECGEFAESALACHHSVDDWNLSSFNFLDTDTF
jgi:hypothetical protein